jgi:hypothetical protein
MSAVFETTLTQQEVAYIKQTLLLSIASMKALFLDLHRKNARWHSPETDALLAQDEDEVAALQHMVDALRHLEAAQGWLEDEGKENGNKDEDKQLTAAWALGGNWQVPSASLPGIRAGELAAFDPWRWGAIGGVGGKAYQKLDLFNLSNSSQASAAGKAQRCADKFGDENRENHRVEDRGSDEHSRMIEAIAASRNSAGRRARIGRNIGAGCGELSVLKSDTVRYSAGSARGPLFYPDFLDIS